MKSPQIKQFYGNWTSNGVLQKAMSPIHWGCFVLHPLMHLILLIEISKEDNFEGPKRSEGWLRDSEKELIANRDQLIAFLKTGKCERIHSLDSQSQMRQLVSYFLLFEELKGIESFLDHLALLALLESLFNQSIELTFEDHAWRKSILACCDRFSYPLHPEVKSIKLILNHMLSNDLEYAASKADLKDELGYYIKALYYQKNNDLKQALTHYRKGIAMSSDKIPFPCVTLFFYSYMLALIQEDSVASRKKITGFLRYKEQNYVDCDLFHILYVIGSGKDKIGRASCRERVSSPV